jgi:hypothetical protein
MYYKDNKKLYTSRFEKDRLFVMTQQGVRLYIYQSIVEML